MNGAGGEIGEYDPETYREACHRFDGSGSTDHAVRHAEHYSGDAGVRGGKSPNIFFADVMDEEDAFFDKALEGFALASPLTRVRGVYLSAVRWSRVHRERFGGARHSPGREHSQRNPLDSGTQIAVSHGQLGDYPQLYRISVQKEGADSDRWATQGTGWRT